MPCVMSHARALCIGSCRLTTKEYLTAFDSPSSHVTCGENWASHATGRGYPFKLQLKGPCMAQAPGHGMAEHPSKPLILIAHGAMRAPARPGAA